MKISLRPSILTLLVSLAPLGALAYAQPNTDNAPKADNPANRAPRRLQIDPNMTPEQRLKAMIKLPFARLGASEANQDILAAFVQAEFTARQELTEKGQPLQTALRAGTLPDVQIAALLNTYQVALEDDKARHAKAVADLEKAVDLKKSPKIEATLVLMGVIGDGPSVNLGGGMNLLRRGMMGGQGMGGQQNGRNPNGRGQNGRGGRNNPANPNNMPVQGA